MCSKKTIFKGTIESSTKNLVKDALTDWVATAKRWMEPPIQVSQATDSPFANGPAEQGSSEEFQEPTHLSRHVPTLTSPPPPEFYQGFQIMVRCRLDGHQKQGNVSTGGRT